MDSPSQNENPIESSVPGSGMPARRRRRIRIRRSWVSRNYRLVLGGLVVVTLAGIGALTQYSRQKSENAKVTGRAQDIPIVPAVLSSDREYFPYSIIPGGVRSTEELREAIKNDPVVAKHYADFDVNHVRFERLQKPMLMHVSYRIGSNVFWTRRTLHIKAGETILTDGVNCARGRCGNRMSETLGKTFVPPMEELTEESFDTPALGTPPTIVSFMPEISSPTMPVLPPPIITAIMPTIVESPNEWAPVPRHVFPPTLTGPGTPGITVVHNTPPADVTVPEPNTWFLMAGSLGLLLFGRRLLTHRQ